MLNSSTELASILLSYQKDGYVLVKNLIPKAVLQTLENQIELIQAYTKKNSPNKQTFFDRGTRFVFQEQCLHRIVWAQGFAPAFAALESAHHYMEIVNTLLFASHQREAFQLAQIINQLHIKAPGDGVSFEFHQDAQNRQYNSKYWNDCLGNGSFIQTALALDTMNDTNGTLEFYQGSHQEGYLDLANNKGVLSNLAKKYSKVSIQAEKGDVLFFHPFCVHGSKPNRSQHERKLFINGYCPASANHVHYPGCGVGKII